MLPRHAAGQMDHPSDGSVALCVFSSMEVLPFAPEEHQCLRAHIWMCAGARRRVAEHAQVRQPCQEHQEQRPGVCLNRDAETPMPQENMRLHTRC